MNFDFLKGPELTIDTSDFPDVPDRHMYEPLWRRGIATIPPGIAKEVGEQIIKCIT